MRGLIHHFLFQNSINSAVRNEERSPISNTRLDTQHIIDVLRRHPLSEYKVSTSSKTGANLSVAHRKPELQISPKKSTSSQKNGDSSAQQAIALFFFTLFLLPLPFSLSANRTVKINTIQLQFTGSQKH